MAYDEDEFSDFLGAFRVPHDFPARGLLVLTAYVDESGIDQEGKMFVAGFVGNEEAWKSAVGAWKGAIAPKDHLHLKELRLKERHRGLLLRAGAVPRDCGLIPIFGGVRVGDYAYLIKWTPEEKLLSGYVVCCQMMVIRTLLNIPADEVVSLFFEEQPVHMFNMAAALRVLQKLPQLRFKDGRMRLSAWASVPKGQTVLTEIADYFAYALYQAWKDQHSLRASLCKPILDLSGDGGWVAIPTRQEIRAMIDAGQMVLGIQEAIRLQREGL